VYVARLALARELAALRLAIGEVVTREYLRHELEDLRALLVDLQPEIPDAETARARDELERAVKKSRRIPIPPLRHSRHGSYVW
jgi:uncharacterized membrane protein